MNLQRQLQNLAEARRRELIPFVYQKTNGKVQTGPFAGMVIVPKTTWGDGDTVAKLLGVYEDELHDWIYDAVAAKPDLVLNIGCAEGYYAVGLSRLLPNVAAMAIDVNPAVNQVVGENLMANVINGLDIYVSRINTQWLENRLELTERPLIVMDCESTELELLDPVSVPSLAKTSIIVECHDCQVAGITDTLINRFSSTHKIQRTESQYKDPYQFDFLRELSDSDKWCLVQEGRPSSMTWLYMIPNA
jgi:hypothetical protein